MSQTSKLPVRRTFDKQPVPVRRVLVLRGGRVVEVAARPDRETR